MTGVKIYVVRFSKRDGCKRLCGMFYTKFMTKRETYSICEKVQLYSKDIVLNNVLISSQLKQLGDTNPYI